MRGSSETPTSPDDETATLYVKDGTLIFAQSDSFDAPSKVIVRTEQVLRSCVLENVADGTHSITFPFSRALFRAWLDASALPDSASLCASKWSPRLAISLLSVRYLQWSVWMKCARSSSSAGGSYLRVLICFSRYGGQLLSARQETIRYGEQGMAICLSY
jgi:hypothetical protein